MGRDQAFRWRTLGMTFIAAFPALLTPAIIVGGMTFGWFTPTEAAIAACAWAMMLGIFLYRSLSLKQFYKVTMDTIETTAGVLLIVGAASLFGWVLTTTRVTEYTTEALLALTDNRYIILLLVERGAAGGRLLPGTDRLDQHPGAGADAGEPLLLDTVPDMTRLDQLLNEKQDLDAALAKLDGIIQNEWRIASRLVCEAIKPEVTKRARAFAKAFVELHATQLEYHSFLNRIQDTGTNVSSLPQIFISGLGDSKDPSGQFMYGMKDFLEAG